LTSISVERLYKIFGPRPEQMVRRLEEGADQEEIRAEGATAAVVDASFTVRDSETFVVMGLSGSGKSTLIRMLNGLLTPTSGHVHVDGQDITSMSGKQLREMRQRTMSMVFQHFALFPHRTVLDNAGYGLQVQGLPRGEIGVKAREALNMVGLDGWEDRYPQQLSGGMRQRVGLARALAAGTDVLLMDESFSALDPLIKREMQDQLIQLQAQLGKTIVFITHDLNEAMRLGDRIAVMRAGRIVQIGTSEEILNKPADDYVSQFVQDVDRSRVLTAASVAQRDGTTIRDRTSPEEALVLMREHQAETLFVTDTQEKLLGALTVTAAERAHRDGLAEVAGAVVTVDDPVRASALLSELFPRMAGSSSRVPVVDEQQRLLGAVTAESVFQALRKDDIEPAPAEGDADLITEGSTSDA
jgi:glycine betaine/proline transport system ATP-binding protein